MTAYRLTVLAGDGTGPEVIAEALRVIEAFQQHSPVSFEITEIPCGGQSQAEIDNNDCSEGSVIGGLLGAGIALSSSRGKDRFWAVPAGGTAGALIGCQVDGG